MQVEIPLRGGIVNKAVKLGSYRIRPCKDATASKTCLVDTKAGFIQSDRIICKLNENFTLDVPDHRNLDRPKKRRLISRCNSTPPRSERPAGLNLGWNCPEPGSECPVHNDVYRQMRSGYIIIEHKLVPEHSAPAAALKRDTGASMTTILLHEA